MPIQSIAVFCSSKPGNDTCFIQEAEALGEWMALKKIHLVYGGGNVGLMGTVANAVLQGNGTVTGVIPQMSDKQERSHKGLTELIVVDNMHYAKKENVRTGRCGDHTTGGYGTLDELFEMITWKNLSIHEKNIFILNINEFYRHLLAHVNTMEQHGFLYENPINRIKIVSNVKELFSVLQ